MTKTQAVTNLVALEERCGPLCQFDKPVKIDEGEFMGHVTAKVVFLSLHDQKFFFHFSTRTCTQGELLLVVHSGRCHSCPR